MKTLILSLILIFGLLGPNHGKPINDIYSVKAPVISEEAYVNDIPFNTWEIAVEAILDGKEVVMEEEAYVNDIPFDTRTIACKFLLRQMIETTGEVNIDDIPFNTEKVLCEQMAARLVEEYRNEKNIHDFPESPDFIMCSYENGVASCVTVKIKMPQRFTARQRKIQNSDFNIIYPVRLDIPKIEMNKDPFEQELLIIPSFSL